MPNWALYLMAFCVAFLVTFILFSLLAAVTA